MGRSHRFVLYQDLPIGSVLIPLRLWVNSKRTTRLKWASHTAVGKGSVDTFSSYYLHLHESLYNFSMVILPLTRGFAIRGFSYL